MTELQLVGEVHMMLLVPHESMNSLQHLRGIDKERHQLFKYKQIPGFSPDYMYLPSDATYSQTCTCTV